MPESGERVGVVRVVIADDDPDIRVLLRSLLDLDHRIEVAGEACDGAEALERFTELHPDVLVLDERMPGLYGLEVARRVLVDHPDQAVILCTAFVDDTVTSRAAELGVRSVLGKGEIHRLGDEILRLVS
jgi:two-component system, NarL family, nitrate/nitrite response regulator NarL